MDINSEKMVCREDLPGNGMPMIITRKNSVDYTPQENQLETIKDGNNLK
jgi:hypothetical protein